MRKFLLLATLAAIAVSAGSPAIGRAATPLRMHVPVLMVHGVECPTAATRLPGNYECPAQLDLQMAALESHGWHTITADQLAQDMLDGVCPGDKTFVVTVDDGSLNGYTNGAPIWEAHGFRATFAMVTGKAGDYLTGGGGSKPHFSWDQARDLVARGHGIANHTVMHTAVANDSGAQMANEVGAAQDAIDANVGFAALVFVYPYGSFGTAEQPYLAARFALAFTDPGSNGATAGADENPADPLHAPRIRLGAKESPSTLLTVLGKYAHPC